MRDSASVMEGRNAVLEALRAGTEVERLFLLDGSSDGPIRTIFREAKKRGIRVDFVKRERLDQISGSQKHQGVIAYVAAVSYAPIEAILERAAEKGEDPFLVLLDGIEDPHNLGAIIRTAEICGAHGVVIPKNRAVGITSTVAKASAGAHVYLPVARVTNLTKTIRLLKEKGLWFVCADTAGTEMYQLGLKGPIGLVVGGEGSGVSELVKKSCDMRATIPMFGQISSLNASVAAGILAYEVVRQRKGL